MLFSLGEWPVPLTTSDRPASTWGMKHQIPKSKSRQPDDFSTNSDKNLTPSHDHKIKASTAASALAEFIGPMLRNAGVFTARHDTEPFHDIWTPIQPSEAAPILDWVRRELLTFGYLRELAFSDFSFAGAVTEDLDQIYKAFRSILGGHAYLTLVDGKPAAAMFNGVQRTILTAAPRIIDMLGGDPVESLHDILHGAALTSRLHSQTEVDALLRWTDEVFINCAIEAFTAAPSATGKTQCPSKAEREAGEIVSVVLGRRTVRWATDQPGFYTAV